MLWGSRVVFRLWCSEESPRAGLAEAVDSCPIATLPAGRGRSGLHIHNQRESPLNEFAYPDGLQVMHTARETSWSMGWRQGCSLLVSQVGAVAVSPEPDPPRWEWLIELTLAALVALLVLAFAWC